MWLLSTDRAELRFFATIEQARQEVYAILSHVWDKTEQSFQDTQALRTRCVAEGTNPRDFASAKVRNSCELAEANGYKWIWNDTCCIDKNSSAELSEAINSMFAYYTFAEVCFAYLRDVPADAPLDEFDSPFRKTRWHQRGWTLQELIAPEDVVFVSQDWKVIGTKADIAPLLEEITSIPATILRLEEEVRDISIARRMSWAAKRETTRPEDEAYCLMGIFEVNMPTLYGEGKQAFRRLQEEIMRKSVDTSLFAWADVMRQLPSTVDPWDRLDYNEMYLFAPTPGHFADSSRVTFTPRALEELRSAAQIQGGDVESDESTGSSVCEKNDTVHPTAMIALPYGVRAHTRTPHSVRQAPDIDFSHVLNDEITAPRGLPSFTVTSYGVHARIPVVEISNFKIAILFASCGDDLLGLLLSPCDVTFADPARPLYHPCVFDGHLRLRLISLTDMAKDICDQLTADSWRDIYLTHLPLSCATSHILINRGLSTPFRIPQRFLGELRRAGFKFSLPQEVCFPWDGFPPVTLTIFNQHWFGYHDIEIHLGRCMVHLDGAEAVTEEPVHPHWANLTVASQAGIGVSGMHPPHDCVHDHINNWPELTRTFTPFDAPEWAVAVEMGISFTPCALNPDTTFVLDISFRRWHRASGRVLYPGPVERQSSAPLVPRPRSTEPRDERSSTGNVQTIPDVSADRSGEVWILYHDVKLVVQACNFGLSGISDPKNSCICTSRAQAGVCTS